MKADENLEIKEEIKMSFRRLEQKKFLNLCPSFSSYTMHLNCVLGSFPGVNEDLPPVQPQQGHQNEARAQYMLAITIHVTNSQGIVMILITYITCFNVIASFVFWKSITLSVKSWHSSLKKKNVSYWS